jgi:O-antigen/teichoic acid export membrane protein
MANLATRGATLFLRFGLSFYIVSYLGLKAAGIYGLTVGAVGILPAAIGWGLNYFVAREVVGLSPDQAAPLVRDRLAITLGSLLAVSLVAAYFIAQAPADDRLLYCLVLALVWLETIALDLYMPLIGLELAFLGNFLVFVRSALWVPVIVIPGLFYPQLRSLEMLLGAWIASHFLANLLLWRSLGRWPMREALERPVKLAWAIDRVRGSWFIYLSDLGLVGLIFLDRYIVGYMLGLTATGIYTFYWSITNALQTLIMTAVVQIALPRMIRAFRGEAGLQWGAELRRQLSKTLILSLILSLCIYILTELIIRFSPAGRFPVDRPLFLLLLISAVIRACSDMLNVGLTSTGEDKYYAATNFFGMFVTVCLGFLCMYLFGLVGAGISMVSTSVSLLFARMLLLRHVRRKARAVATLLEQPVS